MKWIRKDPEIVEAFQWWRNGDHPQDGPADQEGAIIQFYRSHMHSELAVHTGCGHRWRDHGFMPAWYIHGRNAYEQGERVCPGDYIIIVDVVPGAARFPKHKIAGARSFERIYEPMSPPMPLVVSQTQFENMRLVENLPGGVLVIPDEMMKENANVWSADRDQDVPGQGERPES